MIVNERDWFAGDEGMRMPRTRMQIRGENRAQHDIADEHGYSWCRTCGAINANLDVNPCVMPIGPMREIIAEQPA